VPLAQRSRRALAALLLLVPLVVAGVLTRGFGMWPAPPPPQPAAPAAEEPMILLRMLEPGAEPRRVLRWSFVPGRREAWTTRTEHAQSIQVHDKPAVAVAGVSEQEFEVVVSEVDAEGRARLAWTFHPERPLLEGGATPASVARQQKISDSLGTVTGTSRLTSAGVSFDAALRSDRSLDADARKYLVGLEETMRNTSTRLPDDPVGVGAKWETTQIKDLAGIRYQETARYTVLSLEGDRMRIEFEFDAEAPDQPLVQPGVPAEANVRVLEFSFKGQGSSTLDLGRAVPIENAMKGDILFVSEAHGTERGRVRFTQTFGSRTTAR
jgi:hypothetical protein